MSNMEQEEHYELNWKGKRNAISEAFTTSKSTMEECKQDSKNWDTTDNLYIEGDSIDALKLLQDQYANKIKMIYIDPPYNTGKRKIYNDNFHTKVNGYVDKHSKWLNMMYPRLILAKKLLRDDGVIFISIDDHEVHNLRIICDEIFGEKNFVANIIWEKKFAPQNDAKWFSESHDHIFCYSKNKEYATINLLPRSDEANARYKNYDNDLRGIWTSDNLLRKDIQKTGIFTITTPNGTKYDPPSGRSWRVSETKYSDMVKDNRIWFGKNGGNVPRLKRFLSEVQNGMKSQTIWKFTEVGHNQEASQELRKIFDGDFFFDTPKPVSLLKRICFLSTTENDIILDFFSGSATTAHAVIQLNAKDGGNRKFIMVQLPEKTDEYSEAYKAGYKTIADIGKERIRRAGNKIITELEEKNHRAELEVNKLDIGFRVYKIKSI